MPELLQMLNYLHIGASEQNLHLHLNKNSHFPSHGTRPTPFLTMQLLLHVSAQSLWLQKVASAS